MLRQLLSDNQARDWVFALLALAGLMIGLELVRRLVLSRLRRLAATSATLIDDFLVDTLSATRVLLAGAVSLYLAMQFLTLTPAMSKLIDRGVVCLLLIQAGFWVSRGLVFWLTHRFSQGEQDQQGARAMTLSLLSFLGRVVVWVLVLLLVLDNLGLNVTALVASLGIGGIAVALAVQNILGDLFASLSIAIDKPFVIGDFIIVDELMGTVENVGLKTTRVRSLSGEQIIFSNADLLKSRVRNYKRMQERRVAFSFGVTYDTPPDRLRIIPELVKQAVTAIALARFDRAHFKSFGASSLDFEIVYYVLVPDYNVYMDIQQEINLYLVRAFSQQAIEFAFPTHTVHVHREREVVATSH